MRPAKPAFHTDSLEWLPAAAALHLTCALEEGCTAIHTSDRHMSAAASAFRIAGGDFVSVACAIAAGATGH